MSSDDESIEPFIDHLWYFDSVVSPSHCNGISSPPPTQSKKAATPLARESSLPLSTGGLSFPDLPFPETSLADESDCSPSSLNPSATTQNEEPITQNVFTAMDDNDSCERSTDELYPWMKALGMRYTKDGMIQVKPNLDDGSSESGNLEFSTFFLNKLIDKESEGASNEQAVYSRPQSAIYHDVFRPFDKDHNGLISPEQLRKALANLGLLKDRKDTGIPND